MEPQQQISLTKQYLLNHSQITFSIICSNILKYRQPISNTIIGIVTDCTKPLYRPKQKNYIIQLKVIDQSLNDCNIFGVMCKDCTVYVLSSKKKQLENLVGCVGEVVILDKFIFTLWNNIKLQTKYLKMTEGLYTIDDSNPNNLRVKNMMSMNPQLFEFQQKHKNRIIQLLEWRNKQMYKYFQPKYGISIMNNHCAMVEPFNMLLYIEEESSNFEGEDPTKQSKRVILADSNGNKYGLMRDSQGQQRQIKKYSNGDDSPNILQSVYKRILSLRNKDDDQKVLVFIRGIKSINQSLEIELTETGNILQHNYYIPNPQNLMNYMAIHREGEKGLAQNRIKSGSGQKYICKKPPLTLITQNHHINNTTYLLDLLQLQDKYDHTNKKQDLQINDTYLIKVILIKHQGKLQLYHREYQILVDHYFLEELPKEEKKECRDFRKIGYLYEGSLYVLDRSTEARGKLFEVKIFNCDEAGNFLLDKEEELREMEDRIYEEQKHQIQKKKLNDLITCKLDVMTQQSDFQRMVYLMIEPIRSEKLLFRMVNTKII